MKQHKPYMLFIISIAAISITVVVIGIGAVILSASQDFIESYILLIVTAGLSGFLIPFVLRIIDERKTRSQSSFEDKLARQNKVIEAQVQFLTQISQLLWEFHALIAKVSYYRQSPHTGIRNEEQRAQQAIDAYEEGFWGIVIVNIQAEISKSRRLLSPRAHQELKHFYRHTRSSSKGY